MPGLRRRAGLGLLLLGAAYFAAGYAAPRLRWIRALPPDPAAESPTPAPHRAAGVLHVHTGRSHDAVGTEREIARAARLAGLDFVLLTDHPDDSTAAAIARRSALYLDGVLLLRGQELSLGPEAGRVLLLGTDTLLRHWERGPEALARWVEERGGLAIIAHPRSPRTRDRWRPASAEGLHGWEAFDLADAARARLASPWVVYHVAALLASYPVGRLDHALRGLHREGFRGPAVAAYDSMRAGRPLTAVAGLDAHAKSRWRGRPFPPYEPFFRTLINHVELSAALPRAPDAAADSLLAAIRRGDVMLAFGPARAARTFTVRAPASGLRAGAGDGAGRIVYRLVRAGRTVAWARGPAIDRPAALRGPDRIEVYRYSFRVGPLYWGVRPWILAHPRTAGGAASGAGGSAAPALAGRQPERPAGTHSPENGY